MELENKYVGSKYNSLCEYFCELTEVLDAISNKKRVGRRHYVLAKEFCFKSRCLPIRIPGCTVGGIFIDDNNVIVNIIIEENYYKNIYPKDINKIVSRYIGEKIIIKRD